MNKPMLLFLTAIYCIVCGGMHAAVAAEVPMGQDSKPFGFASATNSQPQFVKIGGHRRTDKVIPQQNFVLPTNRKPWQLWSEARTVKFDGEERREVHLQAKPEGFSLPGRFLSDTYSDYASWPPMRQWRSFSDIKKVGPKPRFYLVPGASKVRLDFLDVYTVPNLISGACDFMPEKLNYPHERPEYEMPDDTLKEIAE